MSDKQIQGVRVAIDRGGTFTDCYASWQEREGNTEWQNKSLVKKLLSLDPSNYSDAPTEGIRRLLEAIYNKSFPRGEKIDLDLLESIRMGTTVATNALLEREGERLGLITTEGFRDVLEIGTQARPNIFDLTCAKPGLLYEEVIEIEERVIPMDEQDIKQGDEIIETISGEYIKVENKPDEEKVKQKLISLFNKGIKSIAICLLHSYLYPEHEKIIGEVAKQVGFEHITLSCDLMRMIKIVPRGHSTCADGYLTPHIKRYIKSFSNHFKGDNLNKKLLFMQSDGGLSTIDKFSGFKAILSGPAAGVVGCAKTSYDYDNPLPVIGFDMGGTSTDVSRYSGQFEHVFETVTAGVIIQAPQLDICTVAAGGGSKLSYVRGLFQVGPSSVGAHPGPVCYRKGGSLAVTDANLILGRLIPEYFPKIFGPNEDESLDVNKTELEFQKVQQDIKQLENKLMSIDEIAFGFIKVANESMCRPIRALTESKGWDTSNHALCCFGGAGGQHACSIANSLGINTILIHKHASILSAYGLSLSDVVVEAQEPSSYTLDENIYSKLEERITLLKQNTLKELKSKGFEENQIEFNIYLNLRYFNTDCSVMVLQPDNGLVGFKEQFLLNHKQEFGFLLNDRDIIVDDIRVRATGKSNKNNNELESVYKQVKELNKYHTKVEPITTKKVYFEEGRLDTKVYFLKDLNVGEIILGPALIIEPNSTNVLEPGWEAIITKDHLFLNKVKQKQIEINKEQSIELDPIRLAIFSNRFMSIAEQMGRTLQKTSVSTNIKERLDFSCALFGPEGGLIANAPHIPVHLGSLSFAVKWQLEYYKKLEMESPGSGLKEGDVIVTNHPSAGGSHLPDITVITPVFHKNKIVFFVASRGHHADIGGILPGSMPPHSKYLNEEGASILSFKLVQNGIFQTDGITDILVNGPPKLNPNSKGTRCLNDNISDLKAQVAANYNGIQLVNQLINDSGLDVVLAYMKYIRQNANLAVRSLLKKFIKQNEKSTTLNASDYMDDGSEIQLKIEINLDGSATFDFTGTSNQVYNNFNAPIAVSHSAILYCLRCLINENIPLNSGCLEPINIIIPKNTLLNPADDAAVVGGNVTTSQRVCDVIFKAFNAVSASQGCCNNLTFGNNQFGYYETIAGGTGAGPTWNGQSAVHSHMTNTRITDAEIFEKRYPVVLRRFEIRKGSGGKGKHNGGDGVIREIEFKQELKVNILSERRALPPYALEGGESGRRGLNLFIKKDITLNIGGKASIVVQPNDRIQINTPGGGGYGKP